MCCCVKLREFPVLAHLETLKESFQEQKGSVREQRMIRCSQRFRRLPRKHEATAKTDENK